MPFLVAEILNFQGSAHHVGVGSLSTKINDQKYLVDIFVSKSLGHRNWLSHLTRQRSRFTGKEIDLAERKLRLLFRLTLLQDIGCEATEESLDRTVRVVDQWYKSNQLK